MRVGGANGTQEPQVGGAWCPAPGSQRPWPLLKVCSRECSIEGVGGTALTRNPLSGVSAWALIGIQASIAHQSYTDSHLFSLGLYYSLKIATRDHCCLSGPKRKSPTPIQARPSRGGPHELHSTTTTTTTNTATTTPGITLLTLKLLFFSFSSPLELHSLYSIPASDIAT